MPIAGKFKGQKAFIKSDQTKLDQFGIQPLFSSRNAEKSGNLP